MFCRNCGTELQEGQALCTNCGTATDVPVAPKETPSNTPAPYKRYTEDVKKLTILRLISYAMSVLLVLAFLFLPIYKATIDVYDVDDFSITFNEKDAEEVLEDGHVTRSFSAFKDFKYLLDKALDSLDDSESFDLFMIFYSILFMVGFEILFGVTSSISLILKARKDISDLQTIDDTTLLRYQEIKKTAGVAKKDSFIQRQHIYSFVLYALFDIVFAKFVPIGSQRYMHHFSGFSWCAVLLLIGLGAFLFVVFKLQQQEKALRLLVLKDEEAPAQANT